MLIYKILLPPEWTEFQARGQFTGSAFDLSSGFVHCSSRGQVGATARRMFLNEPALVVVALDTEALGGTVRWEPSADGGTFSHVYGPLPMRAIAAVYQLAGAGQVDAVIPDQ